jgi:hypothetical protein
MIPSMLEVRHFQNKLVGDWLAVWRKEAARFPDFLAPISQNVLETQILGNVLFDPEGLLIAYQDKTPVGVIHAAFGPNADHSDLSREIGILYAPIIRGDIAVDRTETATALISAAEAYFRGWQTRYYFVGGYAEASPFYTGLYGRTNPNGIDCSDTETLEVLRRMGYDPFRDSQIYRLVCAPFRPAITPKIQRVDNGVLVSRFTRSTEPTWWKSNIYRNFESEEWNLFPRKAINGDPIGGVVFRSMTMGSPLCGPFERPESRFILDYIGVVGSKLRRGIASFLLTVALADLSRYRPSFIVDTIVPNENIALACFLEANRFEKVAAVTSFCKFVC